MATWLQGERGKYVPQGLSCAPLGTAEAGRAACGTVARVGDGRMTLPPKHLHCHTVHPVARSTVAMR